MGKRNALKKRQLSKDLLSEKLPEKKIKNIKPIFGLPSTIICHETASLYSLFCINYYLRG